MKHYTFTLHRYEDFIFDIEAENLDSAVEKYEQLDLQDATSHRIISDSVDIDPGDTDEVLEQEADEHDCHHSPEDSCPTCDVLK